MEQKKSWIVYRVYLAIVIIVVSIFCCACTTSSKVTTDVSVHHRDSSRVDSMLTSAVSSQKATIDSLLSIIHLRDSINQKSSEESTERITESITSYIDSLGRKVTQENRVTERTASRQEELRQLRIYEQYEQEIERTCERIDSLYQLLLAKTALEQNDSTFHEKEKIPVQGTSLMDRVNQFSFYFLLLVIIWPWLKKKAKEMVNKV